jgi:hypothetical protein
MPRPNENRTVVAPVDAMADGLLWKYGAFYFNKSEIGKKAYGRGLEKFVASGDVVVLRDRIAPAGFYLVYVGRTSVTMPLQCCRTGVEGYLGLLEYRANKLELLDGVRVQGSDHGVLVTNRRFAIPADVAAEIHVEENRVVYMATYPDSARNPDALEEHRYKIVGRRFVAMRESE